MAYLLKDQDAVFNLAGQVSHLDSMTDPQTDLEINCHAQLTCWRRAPEQPRRARRYAGTRQVYGKPEYRPSTSAPVRPADVNGINKHGGRAVPPAVQLGARHRASVLRLTNTYGPRMHASRTRARASSAVDSRAASRAGPFEVFGAASQLRDFELRRRRGRGVLARRPATSELSGKVYNLGGNPSFSLREFARRRCSLLANRRGRRRQWHSRRAQEDRHRRLRDRLLADHCDGPWVEADLGRVEEGRPSQRRLLPRARRALLVKHISLVDLRVDGDELQAIMAVTEQVLERGWFLLGPEVAGFEEELAAANGVAHAVGVASGTDALSLGLLASVSAPATR